MLLRRRPPYVAVDRDRSWQDFLRHHPVIETIECGDLAITDRNRLRHLVAREQLGDSGIELELAFPKLCCLGAMVARPFGRRLKFFQYRADHFGMRLRES